MDVYIGLISTFEYNDEHYYSGDGWDVIDVWDSQEKALEETRRHFMRNYRYLTEEVSEWTLEEFISELGLPPLDSGVYGVPVELRDRFMEKMFRENHCISQQTVRTA